LVIDDLSEPKPFARITVRDSVDRIYPPQIRRLAPDFFFQEHVYRCSDEFLFLPPGEFTVESSRGPEYLRQRQLLEVHETAEGTVEQTLKINLHRWVEPRRFGWYSGDHHIHGAGCAHYQSPTEGVTPQDMFRQVNGEGLNVGCLLTWGPCFEFQRQFFRPTIDQLSTPSTLLKYDLEISGFGSQALGHVCLLNLREQNYPGSEGTKTKGWPTWTTPVLRWAKEQGSVTGFAHSASGLQVDPQKATQRLFAQFDQDRNDLLSPLEVKDALLPDSFSGIDRDTDQCLSRVEIALAIDRAADRLPNTAIPQMDSVGAMELPVAVTEGVCDFISAMDTPRIAEWNMWYHVLNCGFPLKASGETDFPCMSGTAVGQGRSYVQLGEEPLTFHNWCRNLAAGRSYVSDGYAHALACEASVGDQRATLGDSLKLSEPRTITVKAKVAFAPETPESIAYGTRRAAGGDRWLGDTVTLHGPRSRAWVTGGPRQVELVVNGEVRGTKTVIANGEVHEIEFDVLINQSSWLAMRTFPQLHTNPLEVLIDEQPIRASSQSARWCEETIHQLWRVREKNIHRDEVAQAEAIFQRAIAVYRQRARECAPGRP
jgi:hypothetical protein